MDYKVEGHRAEWKPVVLTITFNTPFDLFNFLMYEGKMMPEGLRQTLEKAGRNFSIIKEGKV